MDHIFSFWKYKASTKDDVLQIDAAKEQRAKCSRKTEYMNCIRIPTLLLSIRAIRFFLQHSVLMFLQ